MKEEWNVLVSRQMKALGITIVVFAERMGVSKSTIGHWLNKERNPNLDQIAKMLYLVGIDSVTLHTSECLMSIKDSHKLNKIEGVPITGTLSFGYPEMGNAVEQAKLVANEKKQFIDFRAESPRASAIQIRGTALSPRIRRDEFIIVSETSGISETDEVLIKLIDKDEYLIKRVVELPKKADEPVIFADINNDMRRIAFPEKSIKMLKIEGFAKGSRVIK